MRQHNRTIFHGTEHARQAVVGRNEWMNGPLGFEGCSFYIYVFALHATNFPRRAKKHSQYTRKWSSAVGGSWDNLITQIPPTIYFASVPEIQADKEPNNNSLKRMKHTSCLKCKVFLVLPRFDFLPGSRIHIPTVLQMLESRERARALYISRIFPIFGRWISIHCCIACAHLLVFIFENLSTFLGACSRSSCPVPRADPRNTGRHHIRRRTARSRWEIDELVHSIYIWSNIQSYAFGKLVARIRGTHTTLPECKHSSRDIQRCGWNEWFPCLRTQTPSIGALPIDCFNGFLDIRNVRDEWIP